MAASNETWTVLPHGPLEQLADNLWRVEGSLSNMPLKRVMTVVRLGSGGVLVHNPIALDDQTVAALEALGEIVCLVVPNGWHRTDLKTFAARYPAATVVTADGSLPKVRQVIPAATGLGGAPADPACTLALVDGTQAMELAMTVTSKDGATVVLTDAVFNMPHASGFKGFVLRHITKSSGGPRISRIARLFMIKDKPAFRAWLEATAATPNLRRVIVAHHETITGDAAGTLRAVAATL